MRISDWSSDVLSSDLAELRGQWRRRLSGALGRADEDRRRRLLGEEIRQQPRMSLSLLRQARIGRALRRVEVAHHIVGDRTTVVSGQSVSVRVYYGGRRIMQKKKQTKQIKHHT